MKIISKKLTVVISVLMSIALLMACAPQGDPMAPYYPTHTAMALELEHLMQTATANAATAQAPQPTPAPNLPTEGTALQKLDNGLTYYADYEAGYELLAPAGWLTLRTGSEEFAAAQANEASQDEALARMLETMAARDAEAYRLVAADLNDNVKGSYMLPNLIASWDPEDAITLKDGMPVAINQIESSGDFPSARVSLANIITNPNNTEVLVLGFTWYIKNDAGDKSPIYTKMCVFKVKQGTVVLTMMGAADARAVLDPDFDIFINSIKLLR